MKSLWILSVLFLFSVACIITTTGCNKESGTSSSLPTGTMDANIGGSSFNSVKCSVGNTGGYTTITAVNGTQAVITINIKNNFNLGIYTFDSTGTNHTATYSSGSLSGRSVNGSVEITKLNSGDDCSGIFNFICTDGTIVSHGSFTAVF